MGRVMNATPRSGRCTPGKDPMILILEAGWTPGTVWTRAENLVPTGIRFSDRPARSVVAIPTELPRSTQIIVGVV